jgi:glycosyltransferase involved in cell wall biosynthesis
MSDKAKLGLCMIVKDEEHCIERCLESIYKHIDYWLICDTGSTDTTKEVIQNFFDKKKIPGEIVEIPWEGFGKSRTKSLELAKEKMEYAWVIDADDSVTGNPILPKDMNADAYTLRIKRGDFTWYRNHIFNLDLNWRYEGVLHEYACCDKGADLVALKLGGTYHIEARTEGGRNVDITPQEKYLKDAEVLLDALTNESSPFYEPTNVRYIFYLAQSYFDSGEWELSKEWYLKRAQAGGWEEEVFYSMYRVGICNCLLERPWQEIQDSFLQAWSYRPCRAEPLWQIARLYRQNGNPRLGYLFAKQGLSLDFPEQDILFLAHDIWDWQLLDEIAADAFYLMKFEEGLSACNMLLKNPNFPKEHHQRTKENAQHYIAAMAERDAQIKEQEKLRAAAVKLDIKEVPKNQKSFKTRKGKSKKGPTKSKGKNARSQGFDPSVLR